MMSKKLYTALNAILTNRKMLKHKLFNLKCLNSDDNLITKLESQISSIDLFYNVFIDNLYASIKHINCTKKDLLIFDALYTSVFTYNTLYNMRINEQSVQDLKYVNNLSEQAKELVTNYCNIIIGNLVITNKTLVCLLQTYFCYLLLIIFYTWSKNHNYYTKDINVFNNMICEYEICINNTCKFIDIYYKLVNALTKSSERIIKIINYLATLKYTYHDNQKSAK